MNDQLSVVIVCKNEVHNIGRVLESVKGLCTDVVVYDNGSTDGTVDLLKNYDVRVHRGPWLGFGKTKQTAVGLAHHNWILSLDGDEALDPQLHQEIKQLSFQDPETVYQIPFKNFLGNKHLKWGEWGSDRHIRIFNRSVVNWNEAEVHEALVIPPGAKVVKLKGSVLHATMKDTVEYSQKMVQYALLNAEKYFKQGKRSSWLKRYVSPPFTFLKHYIFMLGFLDGWEGLVSAKMTSFYTFLKYTRLHELHSGKP